MIVRVLLFLLVFNVSLSQAQETLNILFVGNSLTYYNNLPALVQKAAASEGLNVETAMIAKPNYAIIDHLQEGEVEKQLQSGKFDYVIVQQGPSSQPEGRKMLIDDGKKLAQICTKYEAQLCFLMVWPSLNYYSTFDGVIKSHQLAAHANEAILLPVGELWKEYFDKTKDFSFYGPDGFHPSLEGSQEAARIIIEVLSK